MICVVKIAVLGFLNLPFIVDMPVEGVVVTSTESHYIMDFSSGIAELKKSNKRILEDPNDVKNIAVKKGQCTENK